MTVVNWVRKGVRGVRLETILIGGRLCTRLQALDRFHQAVTRSKMQQYRPTWNDTGALQARTEKARQRAAEASAKRLEAAGA